MASKEKSKLLPEKLEDERDSDPKSAQAPVKDSCEWRAILKTLAGPVTVTLGNLAGIVSFGCVQALGKVVPGFEVNVWRFAVQALTVLPVVTCKKIDLRIPRESIVPLIVVALAFCLASFSWYETAKYIPAGEMGCLNPTLILLMTSAVSAVMEKQCQLHIGVATVMCCTGSILYMQPEFIFHGEPSSAMQPLCGEGEESERLYRNKTEFRHSNETMFRNHSETDSHHRRERVLRQRNDSDWEDVVAGYGYALLNGLSYTVVILGTNQKLQEISSLAKAFWAGLTSAVVSLIAMIIFETPYFPVEPECQALLLTHALFGGVCQVIQLTAISLMHPVAFSLFNTLMTVYFCIAQYTVLRHISAPRGNAFEIVGACLVVVGNAMGPLYHMRKANDEDLKSLPKKRQSDYMLMSFEGQRREKSTQD